MKARKAKEALLQVAQKNGVSPEEVRREIEAAIAMARENPDSSIQAFWNHIPHKGEFPTPEEAILHIAGIIEKEGK